MTGDTVGGVWNFNLELARALAPYGVEVILAAMGGDPADHQRAAAAAIANLQLHTSKYRLEWMDDPWADVQESGAWLLDMEKQLRPDIIHLNSYGHGAFPWQAPVVLTAHSCVASWWASVKGGPLPSNWNRYRSEVEYAVKSADFLTAPSAAMLRAVEENYGAGLPGCRVIPNGRDAQLYRAGPKEQFVLTAGRLWDEAKNVAAVAKIAANLPWAVYVAGEDRHPNGASTQLAGCRVLGRLSHSELADWYARAAIYVLPARYEPFGLSALEAALSGCALVLGDIESLREVWDDTAIFVPPDDTGQLEAVLRELIAHPARREELAGRSHARALTFTPDRMARQYLDVYQTLANLRSLLCAS
ncbi:MAG TPA: glycosyltransferase family 4 protein [Candidatus Sulfopaludibacter sp.]|jgi:glycosyltransferase involved in cell wall biosynthesis|nr:glycosyltransferase family 4 protein [Candidatus Sulfopaludibacter sp.]